MDIDRIGTSANRGPVNRSESAVSDSSTATGQTDTSTTPVATAASAGRGEVVELSTARARGGVPFDASRVEALKAAIAEGRYPIDNQRLAANILAIEKLLA